MIPIVLITGFLGSGKTTLLRRLIEQARSRRLACIVNEFGPVDIDGQLIDLPPGQLVSIPGGSIFCQCLVGEFIRVLRQVANNFDPASGGVYPRRFLPGANAPGLTSEPPPEGVLIEASGMADPKVVGRMLAETGLDTVYDLRHIVTVVDPGSFLKLVHTLPNITAQVEASDRVLLNKTDLYEPGQIEDTEARILEINPSVRIVRTQYCQVGIDLFDIDCERSGGRTAGGKIGGAKPPRSLVGEYAACRDPHYVTRTIGVDRPIDPETLMAELRALAPHVYRAKGFVPTTAGAVFVDVSAGGVTCEPAAGHAGGTGQAVIIAAPQAQPAVEAFARRLKPAFGLTILG